MRNIKLFLLLIFSLPAMGQETSTFLKNWKSYPVPTNEVTLYSYCLDRNNWFVYLEEDEVRIDLIHKCIKKVELPFEIEQSKSKYINLAAPLAGLIDAVEVTDGYLVGFNRGEWGGELYWFSKDGKKKREISGHQIVQFIKRDNKIYAIEGLAHLTMSEGSIIKIEKNNKKWVAREYLKLPSAPDVIKTDCNNNFIILTSSGLFSVDEHANMSILIEAGIWEHSLYPTSMVVHNNIVYIGMRKGAYKYNLKTKEEEWLMPE